MLYCPPHRQAIRAGIFGKTEYDLKIPDMDTKEHLAAFRHVLLGLTLAAILSNMDRVDMSIGIIPISQELGWNKDTAGLVQSAFFQGFMLSQVRTQRLRQNEQEVGEGGAGL